ncbi:MAG: ethanolamine ammonia-lyase subunit EutB [Oscillospiraceae bacterium]|nr:ethanolamine ammonia-lyase subunit EutB [Oscillospiraceae bacterium]
MVLKTSLYGKTYEFKDVKEVLAKANEPKSGDVFQGIAAETALERVAAKVVLSHLTVGDLTENPAIPYESDFCTRVILDGLNTYYYNKFKNWTLGDLREYLIDWETAGNDIRIIASGFSSEVIAGLAKLMSNMDLACTSKKLIVTTRANTEVGRPEILPFRSQPNHPTDDIDGIMISVLEGIAYGCGDAMIGVNPVEDNVDNTSRIAYALYDFMEKWECPTQSSVLSHITTQMKAVEEGAPLSLFFQSIAGSEPALKAFGVTTEMLDEANDQIHHMGIAYGPNLMYFETGQGSEMSIDADCGVDEMTLEARTYGFGRRYAPFCVNNVSGFIGPETIYDGREALRAHLEDQFMGKMSGLPMGSGCAYTNHMHCDQNDLEIIDMLMCFVGTNYVAGLPLGDDVMLSYQDNSYHDNATMRLLTGRKPVVEFHQWMMKLGLMREDASLTKAAGDASFFLRN